MAPLQILLKRIIFFIISLIFSLIFSPLKYLISKKKVIILQTYSKQLYCDNTRYLYEFLSNKEDVDVYWVTNNTKIKEYITDKGWKYISFHKPIQMVRVALTTKMVIDNGTGFFNIFNILNTKSVIKISLQHGCGPKITLRDSENLAIVIKQINDIGKFDYINFPSNYSAERMGKNMYFLPDDKIVSLGYPRCDQFFDRKHISKCFQQKSIAKKLVRNFTDKDKIILYTPTWRPYPYDSMPLNLMDGLDMQKFNNWLSGNNLFFFCTIHSHSGGASWPDNLDRIVLVNKTLHPLFDLNKFMLEVDLLLNDYSTTSTDFSILERPQLFYMPDYEFYSTKKGFFEEYRDILPGKEIFTYKELIRELKIIFMDESLYSSEFINERKELLQKYYDSETGDSCDRSYEFIMEKLNNNDF
jgi:CDP-glycerol glycerophosphotransferase (TagB/SpsB family)